MYKNPTDYFMHVIANSSTADKLAAEFSAQVCTAVDRDVACRVHCELTGSRPLL